MTEEIPAGWTDMLGQQLVIGDQIAAALTIGRSAELRVGQIVGWSENKSVYASEVRKSIRVVWETSSLDAARRERNPDNDWVKTWGPIATGKPTSLQYDLKKFIKL